MGVEARKLRSELWLRGEAQSEWSKENGLLGPCRGRGSVVRSDQLLGAVWAVGGLRGGGVLYN